MTGTPAGQPVDGCHAATSAASAAADRTVRGFLSPNIPAQDWARAVSAIEGAAEILLACHVRPDGDALGSMLAVAGALRLRGGRARVVASFGDQPFGVPALLRFLPGLGLLTPPEQAPPDPAVMITFDVSSVDRLGVLAGQAGRAGELIVLDHHPSNPRFGTVNLIDPAAAATAVLAAELITGLGVGFTREIACGLYTGLVTDTGSFRFSTTPQVHGLAARLIAAGADPEDIARQLWDSAPFGYLQVLSAALGRAVLEPAAASGNGLVWTTVTRDDRVAHGRLPAEAAEPVIGELRRSAEADVAVVLKESDDGRWHVSTRSKGRVDVGWVCMQLGGGGHSQAAGFTAEGPAAQTMNQLRKLLDRAGPARRAAALSMGETGR
ncbi:MAG TPA: bifunctional oligoribonuclease/PAP phosphatase NrnA [Streptosporangiaceae bacterium]